MSGKRSVAPGVLGHTLIKSRQDHRRDKRKDMASQFTSNLEKPAVLKSTTHESPLEDFISTAELANTEFAAERSRISKIVDADTQVVGILSPHERRALEEKYHEFESRISIPRRPRWQSDWTAQQLDRAEQEAFLDWRRDLAEIQKMENLTLTPFERNLGLWRQLWRVIERSDVVVQIVDARCPLLFRCEDLEKYVKEVDVSKINVLLINKSDLLNQAQREAWAQYFDSKNVRVAFWTALDEQDSDNEDLDTDSNGSKETDDDEDLVDRLMDQAVISETAVNSPRLLTCDELLTYFLSLIPSSRLDDCEKPIVIGLTGYPNVGKSSTLNRLLDEKRVATSATPGKTKHFQTFLLSARLTICDCPGLVMPSFALSKEQLLTLSVLPIDEMRDWTGAINLISSQIRCSTFRNLYGIRLPSSTVRSSDLLTAYSFSRGYMGSKGVPDASRAARELLKDYANGVLVWCYAPPGVDEAEFNGVTQTDDDVDGVDQADEQLRQLQRRQLIQPTDASLTKNLDSSFFVEPQNAAHINYSARPDLKLPPGHRATGEKPWRNVKKSNTKRKLRNVYGHLDA